MAPIFTVINHGNPHSAHIITTLAKFHSDPMVDGKSCSLEDLRITYKGLNGRFFAFHDNDIHMYSLNEIDMYDPQLLLSFDTNVNITKRNWFTVSKWLKSVFNGNVSKELHTAFCELFPPAVKVEKFVPEGDDDMIEEPVNEYGFRKSFITSVNGCKICVCEIVKPFTDKPYTIVLRDYDTNSYLRLFTGLFVCTSWGVSSKDVQFLHVLWKYLDMHETHGDICLEKRLHEDVESCKPENGGRAEPEVYRESLEYVENLLRDKMYEPIIPKKFI